MKIVNMSKNKYAILYSTFLIIGVGLGYLLGYQTKKPVPADATKSIREQGTDYKFIRPLLAVYRQNISIPTPVFAPLAAKINNFIAVQKSSGVLDTASLYFINYGKETGSFAINEKAPFTPASLLKVVIMVAYLKKSDTDPSILQKELFYNPTIAENLQSIPFESPSTLVVGNSYSVSDLINKMIIDSDNGAMNVLIDNIDTSYLNTVYANLGLKGPTGISPYAISVEDYALFLRILYNGTYLSDLSSEKALSILSKATFNKGIVAGLPAGTIVAHKFGEHVNGTDAKVDSVELHDCGFVYLNSDTQPYLLCIMTRGNTLDGVEKTISGISKLIYDEVSKQ